MSATKQSELDKGQLRLLLVGDNEDFGYLRNLLSRTGDGHLVLDHARSAGRSAGAPGRDELLLLRMLQGLHRSAPDARVIFLSDHMDEAAVDAALNAGTGAWVQTSNGDEPSIRSTIRDAIDALASRAPNSTRSCGKPFSQAPSFAAPW
jgi:DNA-binding NarL/FixJ family response regulator